MLSRTIAHETAHGLFFLRHTFSEENTYILPQGTTDNLMDYSGQEATTLYKYQWDLIHNPQQVWFAWLKDEEEAEMINIVSLIQNIRDVNLKGEKYLKIIRDKCPKVAYKNIKLGNIKLSYIHIACADLFEEEIPFNINQFEEYNWTSVINKDEIYFDPSEINKVNTIGKKDNKKYVRYQFYELEESKDNYIELFKKTNNLLFHFVVLEEEADLFESYLFALKDKLVNIELLRISDEGIKDLILHEE